ncbi:substrate-binding domain-containing protein [Sulfurimonas sp.]|uniref:substrate-binding domain-containing protein n=1 Tax=Sulfurimonas sp. TaxID=2022749 RepID=UPI0035688287
MLLNKIYSKLLFLLLVCTSLYSQDIKTIAFAQDTLANDYRKAQVMEAKEAAEKHSNINFVYSNANGRTALLIAQIDRFIKQKVDVLIVGTNDADAVVPVIKKAHDSGIIVIILDRGINGDDYTTFINSDNIKIGSIGAKYIAKRLKGKGKVLLFEGLQKADVTQLRSKGFMDEISKHKGIEVIKRTGNYLRRDAIVEMEKLLSDGIKVDAIFSESDSMVSGARSALLRHKIDPASIITVGCDYTSEAREAIRKGTQTGSVLFPLGGDDSIDVAIKVMSGKKVKKHIVIPVKLVTKDNVEIVKPVF